MVATASGLDELHRQESRENVRVVNFNHNNGNANVNNDNANNRNDNRGAVLWLRGYLLCVAFNQPPSILPISFASACNWNTRVSFTSLSSRRSRIFKVNTSRIPLDLSKYAVFIVFGAFLAITSCSSSLSMLSSMLLPSVSLHLFVIWSLTPVNCLYNS